MRISWSGNNWHFTAWTHYMAQAFNRQPLPARLTLASLHTHANAPPALESM